MVVGGFNERLGIGCWSRDDCRSIILAWHG